MHGPDACRDFAPRNLRQRQIRGRQARSELLQGRPSVQKARTRRSSAGSGSVLVAFMHLPQSRHRRRLRDASFVPVRADRGLPPQSPQPRHVAFMHAPQIGTPCPPLWRACDLKGLASLLPGEDGGGRPLKYRLETRPGSRHVRDLLPASKTAQCGDSVSAQVIVVHQFDEDTGRPRVVGPGQRVAEHLARRPVLPVSAAAR